VPLDPVWWFEFIRLRESLASWNSTLWLEVLNRSSTEAVFEGPVTVVFIGPCFIVSPANYCPAAAYIPFREIFYGLA
jgi:hypothetical protein